MKDKVEEILNNDVEVVLQSPQLLLSLLQCYSKLYLFGASPRMCSKCQRGYYSQLKKDGIMKAEKFEEIKNRTCKPKWNGLCYVSKAGKHFASEYITDKEAIDALNKGFLFEKQFDVLPEGYNKVVASVKEGYKKSKKKTTTKKSE